MREPRKNNHDEFIPPSQRIQAKNGGPRPALVLASVMWALFVGLGGGMAMDRVPVTWFGVVFVLLCFGVAIMASLAASSSKQGGGG